MSTATNKEVLVPEKLRVKAFELVDVLNIYNYLKLNGDFFNYSAYTNRALKTDKIESLGLKSLDRVLDTGVSNCLDINILFYLMLKEINIKSRIWYGTVKLADNKEYDHVWVTIDDEVWDLTCRTGRNYEKTKELSVMINYAY